MAKKKLQVKPKEFIMNSRGKPTGVVLDIDDYEDLVGAVEDLSDAIWMESVRHERKDAVPWEDVEKRLKEDGLI